MLKIIVAGLLALPALLVMAVTAPVIGLLAIPALALLCYSSSSQNEEDAATSSNITTYAIISGGSSGIGLAIAHDCVKRGYAHVTILARDPKKLQEAHKALELEVASNKSKTVVSYKSVDVSDAASLKQAAQEVMGASSSSENKNPKTVYLFCCAGASYPSTIEDTTSETFAKSVQTNQLGAIYTVQAFLPYMKSGTIVFTSSILGQLGVFGFSSYCPTKFALRGFAEVLHSELSDTPINVQIAFPPDTDTPGFAEENKSKPQVTKLISETAGLSSPEEIAQHMVQKATQVNPPFFVYFTFEGWMLAALTAGMSPVATMGDAISQVALMSLFRLVSLFYLNDFWRVIRNHNNSQKKPKEDAVEKEYKSD